MLTSATETKAKLDKITDAKDQISDSDEIVKKNNAILQIVTTESGKKRDNL